MADTFGTAEQGTGSSQGSARAKFDEAAASAKSLADLWVHFFILFHQGGK